MQVSSDAHPAHHNWTLLGREGGLQRLVLAQQGRGQPGGHLLLPEGGQGRQQGDPGGQGPRGDRGAERALRRRHSDRPAHGDWLLALLQGFNGEEEGSGNGGGEEAPVARGGEDGRWCRVCQVW